MTSSTFIQSRDNPLLKELRKLAQDNTAYRHTGRVWLEGDHLCSAAIARGVHPAVVVMAESWAPVVPSVWTDCAAKTVVIPDALFQGISGLESPSKVGFVLQLPEQQAARAGINTVVLDRVQDAGNVGSILRSAAAFGFAQVIALKGTAALWGAKVVRAGMGAHFALHLVEGVEEAAIAALQVPLVVTSSHQGVLLPDLRLPQPCAWVMGHEGQGVGEGLMAQASHFARIPQPGGEESLNVAAAAAVCLYASSVQA